MNRTHWIAMFAISLCFGLTAHVTAADYAEDEVLVAYHQESRLNNLLNHKAIGASVREAIPALNVERVKLKAGMKVQDAIRYYQRQPWVKYAEPNYKTYKRLVPNDPLFDQQYGATQMRLPEAWDVFIGAPEVVVAINDDGVDTSHPDLRDNLVPGRDVANDDNDPSPDTPFDDHGTHVAGIAGATANNGAGVAGMGYRCRIMPIKIWPVDSIDSLVSHSAEGIIWATDNGAKVINMSYGYRGSPTQTERDAVNYAWSRGVLLVSAAGNIRYNGFDSYPDGFANVMSIAATDSSGLLDERYTDYGPRVDAAAPGTDIMSTLPGNNYGSNTGTSMAGPGVAGVAGLLFAYGGPAVTNVEVRQALESTAVPIGTDINNGRIDAAAALASLIIPIDISHGATSIAAYQGTQPSGDLLSIQTSNNIDYTVGSIRQRRLGATAGAQINFRVDGDLTKLLDSYLFVEAAAPTRITNSVWVWNFPRNRWDVIRSWAANPEGARMNIRLGKNINSYVRNQEMRVVVRALLPERMVNSSTGNFRLGLDFVQFQGRYKP